MVKAELKSAAKSGRTVFQNVRNLVVEPDSHDRRLDNFLITNLPQIPHSRIYNIIRTGQVRVNGGRSKARNRLCAGDRVRIPPLRMDNTAPDKVAPDRQVLAALEQVLYEDVHLIALDKPSGVAVHAGSRHSAGLIETMRQVRPHEGFLELAHRLDKDTSGILLICKDRAMLRDMHAALRRENAMPLAKTYTALVQGRWSGGRARVDLAETSRHRSAVEITEGSASDDAVRSVSEFRLRQRFKDCALVDIELHTGRMHQARRHALHIGHPIAGDRRYGNREFNAAMRAKGLKRMFLHASRINFLHPRTDRIIDIESKLPEHLRHVLDCIEND